MDQIIQLTPAPPDSLPRVVFDRFRLLSVLVLKRVYTHPAAGELIRYV